MSSERPDPVLISELRESVSRIEEYLVGHSVGSFRADMRTRDAVCMRLIVIGEAANRLTDDGKARLPHLNWDGMAGLRHMLAHDYGAASPSLLWSIVTVSVPQLADALSQLPEDSCSSPSSPP
ncbi:MAG: DUF86 domain-containing protein [Brevundimonas sp.]|uniref:HepT-like ribonuclease domain-containing protein n=1 Tax=Brevundimonas sp. TaxID=1871086 RepID=UPI00391A5FB7